jgi:hypothetical protein
MNHTTLCPVLTLVEGFLWLWVGSLVGSIGTIVAMYFAGCFGPRKGG